MNLSDEQIAAFGRDGYLFFPQLFSREEIEGLRRDLPDLLAQPGPEVVRERDDPEAVRLVYGADAVAPSYHRMSRHPRLLGPVRQLTGEEVYIHQTRLNPKLDYGGGTWDWHQDFGSWHRADAMPAPRAIMTAIFLDDATAANAPLLIVPGSQHHGLVQEVNQDDVSGYVLHVIDRPTLGALVAEGGLVPLTGPAGSVCFLHCNIVHGSSNNITPLRRAIWYVNYNAVSNACQNLERAQHHNNRDHSPLTPLSDDCLLASEDATVGA
ncbi:MAG: phytanoyl-CoA dioxygenase family protein [Rhodospirillales bacterium]